MKNLLGVGLLGVALFVWYYNVPVPDDLEPIPGVVEVIAEDEVAPPIAGPKYDELVNSVNSMLTDSDVAIALSRAYGPNGWAELIARDEQIKTNKQFVDVYRTATKSLFLRTPVEQPMRDSLDLEFEKFLKLALESTGGMEHFLDDVPVTDDMRYAYTEAFLAVSWACWDAWLEMEVPNADGP